VWQAVQRPLAAVPLLSLLLLIPCFWQSRIQAGDLSSHIYNAWLAQLIELGQAPGLYLAHPTTNVLFDLALDRLLGVLGAGPAQRIAVAVSVLIFSWGAFAFASVIAGRRAWHLLPLIAMLSYGWAFHMGFFDFYLSLGICFAGLAWCWNRRPLQMLPALALVPIAWLAHAIPVVWALGILVYARIIGRLSNRLQVRIALALVLIFLIVRVVLGSVTQTIWYPAQIMSAIGVDQLWVFDRKYAVVCMGLLALWGLGIATLYRDGKIRDITSGIPYQICALTVLGICILPSNISIPGYRHSLSFIAERMSLPIAVCLCGLIGRARVLPRQTYVAAALALLFFGFLYHDEGILNSVEDRMEHIVAQAPPGQRMLSAIKAANLRVNAFTHMIDRACIGRCYSYANYEPASAAFRVRTDAPNPIVTASFVDSWRMELGTYVLKESEIPVYGINLDSNQKMVLLSLLPGVPVGITEWNPL